MASRRGDEQSNRPSPAVAVTCRPPLEADFDVLSRIRNDIPTQLALLAYPKPNSPDDVRRWIGRRTSEPATLFFVLADADDRAVGFAQVVGIDDVSRHGMFGIAIDAGCRGRGYGRAGVESVCAAALAGGRLDKLVLHVAADNVAAYELYRSAGFRVVGTHLRHHRGPERWHDVVVMERLLTPAPAP